MSAAPETGLVVVTGTADAERLRRRIERTLDRPVKIISDSAAPEPHDRAGWGAYANRWVPAPPEPFQHQPYGGGWAAPRAPPRLNYGAPQMAYPYAAMNHPWEAPPLGRHVSRGVPVRRRREYEEEGLDSCCSIQ